MFHPLGARLSLNYHLLITSLLFPQCFWNLHSKHKNRMQHFNWNDKGWNTRNERKWLLRGEKIASQVELNVTANTWSQSLSLCPPWHRYVMYLEVCLVALKRTGLEGHMFWRWCYAIAESPGQQWFLNAEGLWCCFHKFEIEEVKQHCDVFLLLLY